MLAISSAELLDDTLWDLLNLRSYLSWIQLFIVLLAIQNNFYLGNNYIVT